MTGWQIATALQRAGVDPPPLGSAKTTCPKCSPLRFKHWERCLRVKASGDVIHLRCYHCGYEDWEFVD
jgi:DNA-directed RNA polymerase subunit M/transcription elongation factor TFIIS